jgi:Flp pilus assembly protein TadD
MVAMAYSGRGLHEQARGWDERTLAAARQHFERYPQDVRVLHYIGLAYIRLGDVERGLEWVERARQMDPQDAAMLYNVACAYALAGRTDQALDVLEEALDHAMEIRAWISNDSDFSQLRDHPRFQALLSRMC